MSNFLHPFLGYFHFPARRLLAFLDEAVEQHNHAAGLKTIKIRQAFTRSSKSPLPRLFERGSLARLPISARKSIRARNEARSAMGSASMNSSTGLFPLASR
jgi:hypothetical protein